MSGPVVSKEYLKITKEQSISSIRSIDKRVSCHDKTLGGICEIVGVVLFMVGFFYCAKEALVWSYQSYQRKKQQKRREKKDSNCAIKRVEVLPVDAKPKQLQKAEK